MLFEIGDKVRIKSKKELKKNGYSTNYFLKLAKCEDIVVSSSIANTQLETIGVFNENDLQLILESPKLSLRLSQSGLKLKVKILHQDESLRGVGRIFDDGTYSLWSDNYAEVHGLGKSLCIKGRVKDLDCDKISYTYSSQAELDSFVSALRIMMKDEKLK